jgi:hypothetical protein
MLLFYGNFPRHKTALQAARANLKRQSRPVNLGLYLFYIGPPSSAGAVLGMAHPVPGNGMFTANIASS